MIINICLDLNGAVVFNGTTALLTIGIDSD